MPTNHVQLKDAHPDLYLAQRLAFEPCGFNTTNIMEERESSDYGALDFSLNGQRCKFRVGKITQKKIGFFLTIWKRMRDGPILPYDLADPVDLYIFSARSGEHFGLFVFPKSILAEKGVLSKEGKGGKRAIRVYPPWVVTDSKQAKNTQVWQEIYFLKISEDKPINSSRVHRLIEGLNKAQKTLKMNVRN
ncbi:MAG: MepB family protein [Simkaniaceae bacterium]|nr:MepB family protein [Candidatus Sacchlamyda saccharinae]